MCDIEVQSWLQWIFPLYFFLQKPQSWARISVVVELHGSLHLAAVSFQGLLRMWTLLVDLSAPPAGHLVMLYAPIVLAWQILKNSTFTFLNPTSQIHKTKALTKPQGIEISQRTYCWLPFFFQPGPAQSCWMVAGFVLLLFSISSIPTSVLLLFATHSLGADCYAGPNVSFAGASFLVSIVNRFG